MFSPEQKAELEKPLNPAFVKQRSQAGRELSYIEGWYAIAEANRIFGFDGWTRETLDLRPLAEPREESGRWRIFFGARVRITVLGDVVREGCGFGSGIDRDLGRAHESALKEAETDAMKRALMTFGNQFGLALYDKEQRGVGVEEPEPNAAPIHVNGEPMSAYAARKDGRWEPLVATLRACKTKGELEAWAEKNGADIYDLPDLWRAELKEEYRACLDHVVRGR
jgi:DNA recombination protein Rad52